MKVEDFRHYPVRVWINSPSTHQPYHELHGKVGIGVLKVHKTGFEEISVYFVQGPVHSMMINPRFLEKEYSAHETICDKGTYRV